MSYAVVCHDCPRDKDDEDGEQQPSPPKAYGEDIGLAHGVEIDAHRKALEHTRETGHTEVYVVGGIHYMGDEEPPTDLPEGGYESVSSVCPHCGDPLPHGHVLSTQYDWQDVLEGFDGDGPVECAHCEEAPTVTLVDGDLALTCACYEEDGLRNRGMARLPAATWPDNWLPVSDPDFEDYFSPA